MIKSIDDIEVVKHHFNAYQHLDITIFNICDDESKPYIYEIDRFGNPLDFLNEFHHITYEVFYGIYPEGYSNDLVLPKNAVRINQDTEPNDAECTRFNYYAVFNTLEEAYNYAVNWSLKL